MGALVDEYLKYLRLYLRKKHQFSKDSENRRKQKVLTFLRFCENLGVKRIKDIKEEHYRQFVAQFLNSKATETKRKYLMALKEFFERAHLEIKVNPSKNVQRTKEKKLKKLLDILGINIQDLEYEKIQELLKIL
jgi:site-specific recombinase XerD